MDEHAHTHTFWDRVALPLVTRRRYGGIDLPSRGLPLECGLDRRFGGKRRRTALTTAKGTASPTKPTKDSPSATNLPTLWLAQRVCQTKKRCSCHPSKDWDRWIPAPITTPNSTLEFIRQLHRDRTLEISVPPTMDLPKVLISDYRCCGTSLHLLPLRTSQGGGRRVYSRAGPGTENGTTWW